MPNLPDDASRVAAASLLAKLGIPSPTSEGPKKSTYVVGWRGSRINVTASQLQQLRDRFGSK